MTSQIDPAMPTDPPLTAALDEMTRGGYTGQFGAVQGGVVMCFTCREPSAAGAMRVEASRRLEGVSDPADMLYVAALACPQCDARGTLIINYGPEATPEGADVLLALGDLDR